MKGIYVEWEDHSSVAGWVLPDEIDKSFICKSVGFLVSEDDKHLTISTTTSETGKVVDPLTILKATIRKKKRITNF